MRSTTALLAAAAVAACFLAPARAADVTEADRLFEAANAALPAAQTDSKARIDAAVALSAAARIYQAAGEGKKASLANAKLYWCKKLMALSDIDLFLKEERRQIRNFDSLIRKLTAAREKKEREQRTSAGAGKALEAGRGGRATGVRPGTSAPVRRDVRTGRLFRGSSLTGWRVVRPEWRGSGGWIFGKGKVLDAVMELDGRIPSDFDLRFRARSTGEFSVGWYDTTRPNTVIRLRRQPPAVLYLERVTGFKIEPLAQARLSGDAESHDLTFAAFGEIISVGFDGQQVIRHTLPDRPADNLGLRLTAGSKVTYVRNMVVQRAKAALPSGLRPVPRFVLDEPESLFDGTTPSGWQVRGPTWRIEDRAMTGVGGDRSACVLRESALPDQFQLSLKVEGDARFMVALPRKRNRHVPQETVGLRWDPAGTLQFVRYFGAGRPAEPFASADVRLPEGAHELVLEVKEDLMKVYVDGKRVLMAPGEGGRGGERFLSLHVLDKDRHTRFRELVIQPYRINPIYR